MAIFDEEERKPIASHQIGQDLSLLSVDELKYRITQLQEEILRIEREVESKGATKTAAEALFHRS
ncbi:DUF1192 domain-containing protein [Nitratireductor kimnyeongensis]|uniref:DUF1192 domain-containing protein n=1 Tax=Nitratireductor kimnyeongensis TaxID=430679 RepID=A0ABW0TB50_9HYPH|nr:DUF1192 domain-containing protein [Nitratireductor kimnyeongensis]QZZ37345.1 DUF1192 domain-containing protein [Nitratireductor kimnyeongensis]